MDTQKRIVIVGASSMIAQHCAILWMLGQSAEAVARRMQHRFAGTGLTLVLIKPGPTATPMTAHLPTKGPKLAPVEDVARDIVRAVERGGAVAYVSGKWRLIMTVIRCMPAFVFNHLDI